MYLIPMPKKISETGETFNIGSSFEIALDTNCGFAEYEVARMVKTEIKKAVCTNVLINKSQDGCGADLFIKKTQSAGEEYELTISKKQIQLCGGERGIFLGAQTFRQIVRQYRVKLPGIVINDEPGFKDRGFMHDVTRGTVPKMKTLYELADRASFYKLNQIQLYIEHSFAFKNFSEVSVGKDPLRAEDILLFDEYCAKRHIELVPTLATFGHLYEILSTKSFSKYSELDGSDEKPFSFYDRMAHHTLNVSDKDSFNLVKSMIDEFLPLFSSNRFNICCDETFDIGKGKSAALASKYGEGRLYVDFLKKVIGYVQSKGKKVMFWGDIILKNPEYLNEIPKDADCLYWNYGRDVPEKEIETLSKAGVNFYGCPGACGWNVMMNIMDGSYENIKAMTKYGCKYGAKGILNTDWGDFGHVNLFANSMPCLAFGAAFSWNTAEKRSFDELAKAYSVLEYGEKSQSLVSLLNKLAANQAGTWSNVVSWRETQITDSENARKDSSGIKDIDEKKAIDGYHTALEIESQLLDYSRNDEKSQDIKEFVCAAHGVALFNAAALAIKKYAYHCEVKTALDCNALAVDFEKWFAVYTDLWRERNKDSELYRIREMLVYLCRSLRKWNQKKEEK